MVEGDEIPDVTVLMADGPMPLAELGLPLVVYFYPKDDTAGCTREGQDFTALAPAFAEAGAVVVGISKDSPEAHAKFTAKHALSVALATDPDGSVCEAFGVWVEKAMYGRKYLGIERATFLFGADGKLVTAWRKVRVPGHVDAVLAAVGTLRS
ncbi:peroxiredoxin [Sphingomonas ginsenosidivorax]|uniref:thioredoxin-dependent peroxiredoxin n=1 Tax=Sphingomonas ginsenosidivorax TaxID=862135 RepID=A0A5C6UAX8_9SPHN|nr:peroxiredoxin [Sphingomonas ginsenosidivorax]TXC70037.1 peroxiredoxin [Sphingomonas ginsenosidivorax]